MTVLITEILRGLAVALRACSTFDVVVLVYALLVALLIASCRYGGGSRGAAPKHKFHAPKLSPPPSVQLAGGANWKKQFEGVWLQYKEENFDEFLRFSGTSFALRKVIPVAFFMTRHTLSISSRPRPSGEGEGEDTVDEYFSVKRDFGAGVREWTLVMKMGRDQQSAEEVQAVIDTDESYVFRNWADEREQSISTLSTPSDKLAGVRCVQTRSLLGPDEIRMTFDGYNLKTKESCEMVSYFKRDKSQ